MLMFEIFLLILFASLFLASTKYGSLASQYKNESWQLKFIEIWNDFWNFFIAGWIIYYFVSVRWVVIFSGGTFNIADFVLFVIFSLCIFGHLCVMSKNITEGIKAIIERVLR